jgi:hypothetical protein
MVDQTLNQNHKLGHHKKSPPEKKFTKRPFKDVGAKFFLSKIMSEKIPL